MTVADQLLRTGRVAIVAACLALILLPGCKKEREPDAGPGTGTAADQKPPEPELPPLPEDPAQRVEVLVDHLNLKSASQDDRKVLRTKARKQIIGMGQDATPYLLEHMDDGDFTVRWEMANVQGDIRDPRAIPALVNNILRDDDSHIRWRSMWALNEYDEEARAPAVDLLREAMNDRDKIVRWNAAVGLSMLAREDCGCIDAIHAGVADTDGWRRWEAINALRRVHNNRSVRVLMPIIEGGGIKDRQEAAMALKFIANEAAVDALIRMLDDPEDQVRWRAAQALGEIGDPRARDPLMRLRQNETEKLVVDHIDRALAKIEETTG